MCLFIKVHHILSAKKANKIYFNHHRRESSLSWILGGRASSVSMRLNSK